MTCDVVPSTPGVSRSLRHLLLPLVLLQATWHRCRLLPPWPRSSASQRTTTTRPSRQQRRLQSLRSPRAARWLLAALPEAPTPFLNRCNAPRPTLLRLRSPPLGDDPPPNQTDPPYFSYIDNS